MYVHSNPLQKPPPAVKLPDRIAQLEGLVTSLMERINNPPKWSTSEDTLLEPSECPQFITQPTLDRRQEQLQQPHAQNSGNLTDSFGRISLEESETKYVESIHWTAILDEVKAVFILSDTKYGLQYDTYTSW